VVYFLSKVQYVTSFPTKYNLQESTDCESHTVKIEQTRLCRTGAWNPSQYIAQIRISSLPSLDYTAPTITGKTEPNPLSLTWLFQSESQAIKLKCGENRRTKRQTCVHLSHATSLSFVFNPGKMLNTTYITGILTWNKRFNNVFKMNACRHLSLKFCSYEFLKCSNNAAFY
jgi:hypothetical protein